MNSEQFQFPHPTKMFALLLIVCMLLSTLVPVAALADEAEAVGSGAVATSALEYDDEHPEELVADNLVAASAILVSANGRPLFEKDADTRRFPASTTKILTAILAIENTPDLSKVVTIPAEAAQVPPDSSLVGLYVGEEMTMKDLIYSFFICSGNDAGNAIAVLVGGSIENFVQMMNSKAAELGCADTHFANPHGYHDENHYTTARDISKIAVYAMTNANFRDVCSTTSYTLPASNKRSEATTFWTKNQFIARNDASMQYKYANGVGVKTGFTSKAGNCFVGAAVKDSVSLISVVLYSDKANQWLDSIKLMEYGFATYKVYDPAALYSKNPASVKINNAAADDTGNGELALSIATDSSMPLVCATQQEIDQLSTNFSSYARVELTRELNAPIAAGEVMGNMVLRAPNEAEVSYKLVAARAVNAANSPSAPMDAGQGSSNNLIWLIPLIVLAAIGLGLVGLSLLRSRRGRASDDGYTEYDEDYGEDESYAEYDDPEYHDNYDDNYDQDYDDDGNDSNRRGKRNANTGSYRRRR